jgi:hypothetical protein
VPGWRRLIRTVFSQAPRGFVARQAGRTQPRLAVSVFWTHVPVVLREPPRRFVSVVSAVCGESAHVGRDDYFLTGEAGDGGGALTSPAPSFSIVSFILNVEPGRT